MNQPVTLIGAGLAGSLLGIYLAKRGYAVTIYERLADPRLSPSRGRSINLALSCRGIQALQGVNLAETILSTAIPMTGRMIHQQDGTTEAQAYSIHPEDHINSVSRHRLNGELLNAFEAYPHCQVYFQQAVTGYDVQHRQIQVNEQWQTAPLVLASDGASSHLRRQLVAQGAVDFTETLLDHGYKELTIGQEYFDKLAENFLHIWPRHEYMLIALPNQDQTFTATLFLPNQGENSFATLQDDQRIARFFATHFADFSQWVPDLVNQFQHNPVGQLKTVRGNPWHVGSQLLFLGDAAHGIVPFFGQGMNCSFEDCYVLNQLLDQYSDDWEQVIPAFYHQRKSHADAIAQMSLDNYIEMRQQVIDQTYLKQRDVERQLMARFPKLFCSKYNLVSFSNMPYAEVLKQDHRQQGCVQRILQQPGLLDRDNDQALREFLTEQLWSDI